jgi:hypothetical protein
VALGGEVHDRADRVALHQLQHRGAVTDVAAHEHVPRVAFQVAQVFEVPGVRERVDVDDQIVRPRPPRPPHISRSDEPGAAGDQQIHPSDRIPQIATGFHGGPPPAPPR